MTLAELADRLGIQPRQIRFMIAEGILPPAAKTGRSADAYEEAHVVKGQRYLALYRMGMKPGSIKVLMAFDDAVPILQEGGIELRIDPQVTPQELDVEAILGAVEQAEDLARTTATLGEAADLAAGAANAPPAERQDLLERRRALLEGLVEIYGSRAHAAEAVSEARRLLESTSP